jgi:ribulose-5-phosphate 4-epimerase/fuculose-1-phosphate aldolase
MNPLIWSCVKGKLRAANIPKIERYAMLDNVEKIRLRTPATHSIRSLEGEVSAEEWKQRVDLAALYRIVAMYGWDDLIFTHISARVPGPEHHFLINPYGMMFEEITASSLVKIDTEGNKVQDSPYPVNPAGFTIHSALHMNREDAHCVIHLHTVDGVAMASQECGLLPITQHAQSVFADLAYHDYEGIALELGERERIVADVGDKNVVVLRNHGTLTIGKTCADAFMRMYYIEKAASMQVRALAGGMKPYNVNQGVAEKNAEITKVAFDGPISGLAWPALLRKLDRIDPGYKH